MTFGTCRKKWTKQANKQKEGNFRIQFPHVFIREIVREKSHFGPPCCTEKSHLVSTSGRTTPFTTRTTLSYRTW